MTVINIPTKVNTLIKKLEASGFEAFVVGGCVRDALLNKAPKDWDITTNATYDEILNCLGDAVYVLPIANAKEHNVCIVCFEHERFEIATYRTDLESTDHRHAVTEASKSLKDDLSRRDFTINALAYNDHTGLIDLFDGIYDLKHKLIRTVGNACNRFDEDALRILRAYRFALQLGFTIEADTLAECERRFDEVLTYCSRERIRQEITKAGLHFNSDNKVYADKLFSLVTDKPELNEFIYHALPKCHTECEVYALLMDDWFLHVDCKLAEKLQFAKKELAEITYLHDNRKLPQRSYAEFKKFVRRTDLKYVEKLLEYVERITPYNQNLNAYKEYLKNIQHDAYRLCDLKINGSHVTNVGYDGSMVSKILNYLLDLVCERPELNNKEILLTIVKTINFERRFS